MKSMLSSKRGQFFVIVAVVIVMVLLTLTANYNWIRETAELGNYPELRETQGDEMPKVITRAIYITTDQSKCTEANKGTSEYQNCPIPAAEDFAKRFQDYAYRTDPNFGSILILRDPYSGDIIVKNLLADKKWIKINTKEYKGDIIKLNVPIFSTTDRVEGTITLEGIGSMGVSAPITSLSEEFTKQNLGNVGELEICVSEKDCAPIDLTDPGSFSKIVTNSADNKGNVNYDVCPPPKKADGTYVDSNCF